MLDTVETCFGPAVGNGVGEGKYTARMCPHIPELVRNGIGRNIFVLKQQNAKGSNFLFVQTNSGLLGLNFCKKEL